LEKGDLGGFEVFQAKACGYKKSSFVAVGPQRVMKNDVRGGPGDFSVSHSP
jgi:hypothetical protein